MDKQTFIRKLILFFVGFCVYITIEVCFRGWSSPLMGIMGGILFLIIDSFNDNISWSLDLVWQGILGSITITLSELIVGSIFLANHWPLLWDYTHIILNYNGIICLPFSIIWFFISWFAIFLADIINYYVFKLEPKPYYYLFGKKISF